VVSASSSRLLKAGFKPAISTGGRAALYEAAHVAIDSGAGTVGKAQYFEPRRR
jgi:hypothetical protein